MNYCLWNIGAETEQNIEQEIKTIKNFINQYCNEKKEGNFDFFLLLQFYTKRNTNQDLVYKVALNPAILNTRTTTTAKSFEIQIADLEKSVKELEEKNYKNKQTKSLFLEELEWCINRVLFYNDFFKKSKNTRYREKAKKIYEKYESGYELSEEYEQYVEEILRKENILDLNQEINVANVDERYLERKESCRWLSFYN